MNYCVGVLFVCILQSCVYPILTLPSVVVSTSISLLHILCQLFLILPLQPFSTLTPIHLKHPSLFSLHTHPCPSAARLLRAAARVPRPERTACVLQSRYVLTPLLTPRPIFSFLIIPFSSPLSANQSGQYQQQDGQMIYGVPGQQEGGNPLGDPLQVRRRVDTPRYMFGL
jgi:hypothetical protein